MIEFGKRKEGGEHSQYRNGYGVNKRYASCWDDWFPLIRIRSEGEVRWYMPLVLAVGKQKQAEF